MPTTIRGEALENHLLSDRFRPSADVVWTRQAGTTVLLDGRRGLYYTLNEVASRTWDLIIAGEPLVEILRCLKDEFETSAKMLEADTAALLNVLRDAGLIERIAT